MGNISILLADDSITIQKVVGIIFAGDGYTLTVVDNGAAAIQKAQEITPDVLLIDVLMPGMSGYEVCEKIRAIPSLASKPIVLLTGSFEAFDEAKAKSCGADDHITKPFESQQIIAKVKELYAAGSVASAAPVEPPAAFAAVEPASFVESTAFQTPVIEPSVFDSTSPAVSADETMDFEPAAYETTTAFEPPLDSPQAAVSPDDPWGAFTQQPAGVTEDAASTIGFESNSIAFETEQPDVVAAASEEPLPVAMEQAQDPHIGASWVPVEEQTFEFQEQTIALPSDETQEELAVVVPEEEPAVVVPEEPAEAVESAVSPVMPGGAVALTDEQLKQVLMSVSKETIERIVWEVVPDLAESLIKETIRRITEGK